LSDVSQNIAETGDAQPNNEQQEAQASNEENTAAENTAAGHEEHTMARQV
jgi:hypothetical protein